MPPSLNQVHDSARVRRSLERTFTHPTCPVCLPRLDVYLIFLFTSNPSTQVRLCIRFMQRSSSFFVSCLFLSFFFIPLSSTTLRRTRLSSRAGTLGELLEPISERKGTFSRRSIAAGGTISVTSKSLSWPEVFVPVTFLPSPLLPGGA